jgi:hypothetical protein
MSKKEWPVVSYIGKFGDNEVWEIWIGKRGFRYSWGEMVPISAELDEGPLDRGPMLSEGQDDEDLGDVIARLQRAKVRKLLRDNGFAEDALEKGG